MRLKQSGNSQQLTGGSWDQLVLFPHPRQQYDSYKSKVYRGGIKKKKIVFFLVEIPLKTPLNIVNSHQDNREITG